jgi:hypothetical protein
MIKTVDELKKQYPKLDQVSFDKLVALHNFHGYLKDDKMQQALAFKTLTDTLKNMYIYNDKKVVLKTLCESLVNDNVISEVREDCVILKNYQGRYMLQKTAINYIKHLQFEKSIKDYYIEKQKEKTETIYVNVEKLLSE